MAGQRENSRSLAAEWLVGEDVYQWARADGGKFTVQADIDGLYLGSTFTWGQMLHDRWGRFRLFHQAEAYQHAAQNIGKLAAGARCLPVILQIVQNGRPYDDHFEAVNEASLKTIQALAKDSAMIENIDWQEEDFDKTELGQCFEQIGLPLITTDVITTDLINYAEVLGHLGFDMLASYIGTIVPADTPLPRPGLPSGELQVWENH